MRRIKENRIMVSDCPNLMKIIDPNGNNGIDLSKTNAFTYKKLDFICNKCGHHWSKPSVEIMGNYMKFIKEHPNEKNAPNGCPACKGRVVCNHDKHNSVANVYPECVKYWNIEKNNGIDPSDVVSETGKRYWFECKVCKREILVQPRNFTKTIGCKHCGKGYSSSVGEQALYRNVLKHFPDAINRYTKLLNINNRELDIFIPSMMCAIEYDGINFHRNDIERRKWKYDECTKAGVRLIRVLENSRDGDEYDHDGTCDAFFICEGIRKIEIFDEMTISVLKEIGCSDISIRSVSDNAFIQEIFADMRFCKIEDSVARDPVLSKLWLSDMNAADPLHVSSKDVNNNFWFMCQTCGSPHLCRPYYAKKCKGCPSCDNRVPHPIEQWSIDGTTLIKRWPSASAVKKELGYDPDFITRSARKVKGFESAYGFTWRMCERDIDKKISEFAKMKKVMGLPE